MNTATASTVETEVLQVQRGRNSQYRITTLSGTYWTTEATFFDTDLHPSEIVGPVTMKLVIPPEENYPVIVAIKTDTPATSTEPDSGAHGMPEPTDSPDDIPQTHLGPLDDLTFSKIKNISDDLYTHIENNLKARTRSFFQAFTDEEQEEIDGMHATLAILLTIGQSYIEKYGFPETIDDIEDDE